ncbi:zeta toxin family protein [Streptomyces sp. HYC2]|uniref:zeta toxin family protein n=1 Tax=Streptomyces sp. HYC2 TaxID=2955207 RepID=UPI00248013EE|nr:zeta toxin family protein [Streptomyces sp. HYC2]
MAEARDYFLTEEQLRARFEERVRNFVFSGYAPQDQPVLVLVGAQPAAGKSQAMAAAVQRHADRQLVPLTGDELRAFHPRYEELLAEQPLLFPNATGQASGAWVRMSIEHARAHGYSLMLEGVFRNPAMTVATAEEFAAAKHTVEVLGLGVRAERSRLDSLHRYLESGRWTPPTAHDGAYAMMPQTIAAAEASPAVRRLTITDRTGVDLYVNERNTDGRWRHEPAGTAALEASRARPLPSEEAARWLARHRDILVEFAARGEISETSLPVLRTVTRDADAVAAMDLDPHSAARRAYAALRPLVHALVSQPVTSPKALPLPLLPAEALIPRAHRDAALVAAELDRRASLTPAERHAQDAFRRRLHDRLRPSVQTPGPEAPSRSRPSTAAARSRSTTTRAVGRRNRPAAPGGEQPPHLRRSGPDQGRGRGPQV